MNALDYIDKASARLHEEIEECAALARSAASWVVAAERFKECVKKSLERI